MGSPLPNGRICVFCGAPATSREHLLPDWLQRVLPSEEAVINTRTIGRSEPTEWLKKPFREKSKIVCRACNTGWMSRLETAAQSVLTPCVRREPRDLDSSAQTTVAAWAVKTCLVLQATLAKTPLAPGVHFTHLRKNGEPVAQTHVWLGSHYRAREDPINSVFLQRPISLIPNDGEFLPARDFGYLNFLAVGGVSFVVVGSRYRNQVELAATGPLSGAVRAVWPIVEQRVTWPPELMLDQALIDALMLPPGCFDVRVFPG